MKNKVLILIGTFFIFAFACEKYPFDSPKIDSFTIEPAGDVMVGETVTFTVEGTGMFVIYTGDYDPVKNEGHMYDSAMAGKINHSGVAIDEEAEELTYEYEMAGTYKVVVIATSVGDLGNKIEHVTQEKSITVN
jgi:hypothetical protein